MAKRKPRSAARTARPKRRSSASARKRQQHRRKPETLRLRALEPTFTVNDLDRSVRFYTDVLGFIVGERMMDSGKLRGVMLKAGLCQLGLSQDDWAKGRDRKKGEGMRIWCNTVQDIDELAARINVAGGRMIVAPKDESWGGRSLTVDDPDGFRLTIYRQQ